MARQSTISFEQVAAIADKIKSSGGRPTSRAIRDTLGKGSMGTILKHLQEWQNHQVRKSESINDTLDLSVSKAIIDHIAARVQEATALSRSQIAELQDEANTIIAENESQTDEIDRKERELADLQERFASLSGRNQQLETEVGRISSELASERKTAESTRVALAKAELRLEGVQQMISEFASTKLELENERQKSSELHESAAVAAARLEAAQELIAELRQRMVSPAK